MRLMKMIKLILMGTWRNDEDSIYAKLMVLTTAVSFGYAKMLYYGLINSATWKNYDSDICWFRHNSFKGE